MNAAVDEDELEIPCCGCCGLPLDDEAGDDFDAIWCSSCAAHVLGEGYPAWEATYFAQHGAPCPYHAPRGGLTVARTVDWLAKVLWEAMRQGVADLKATPARLPVFGVVKIDVPWDSLAAENQAIVRDGLTAALAALGDPPLLRMNEQEPIFVLCSRDATAPPAVMNWLAEAQASGMTDEAGKVQRALAKVELMQCWQAAHPELVKLPS